MATDAEIKAAAKAIAVALAPAYYEREEPTEAEHEQAARMALAAAERVRETATDT